MFIRRNRYNNHTAARWGQISSTSETGFRGLYYYMVGDYGKNTSVVREVLEIIVRRRVSIYAAQHKKFFNFQGDSFICSVEACEKFIDFIMENCAKWDKYFEQKEKEIVNIEIPCDEYGKIDGNRIEHKLRTDEQ